MIMETISKAIRLNLKQENTSIQSEELKTTLFGYPIKEDFMTFIE